MSDPIPKRSDKNVSFQGETPHSSSGEPLNISLNIPIPPGFHPSSYAPHHSPHNHPQSHHEGNQHHSFPPQSSFTHPSSSFHDQSSQDEQMTSAIHSTENPKRVSNAEKTISFDLATHAKDRIRDGELAVAHTTSVLLREHVEGAARKNAHLTQQVKDRNDRIEQLEKQLAASLHGPFQSEPSQDVDPALQSRIGYELASKSHGHRQSSHPEVLSFPPLSPFNDTPYPPAQGTIPPQASAQNTPAVSHPNGQSNTPRMAHDPYFRAQPVGDSPQTNSQLGHVGNNQPPPQQQQHGYHHYTSTQQGSIAKPPQPHPKPTPYGSISPEHVDYQYNPDQYVQHLLEINAQYESENASLRQHINELNNALTQRSEEHLADITRLTSINDTTQRDSQIISDQYETLLVTQNELEKKVEEERLRANNNQQDYDDLFDRYHVLSQDHQRLVEASQAFKQQQKQQHEREKALQDQLNDLRERLQNKESSMRESFLALQQERSEVDIKLDTMSKEHSKLQDAYADLHDENRSYKQQLQTLQNEHNALISSHQQLIDQCEQYNETVAKDKQQMQQDHQHVLKNLQSHHENSLKALQERFSQDITRLQSEHKDEQEAIRHQFDVHYREILNEQTIKIKTMLQKEQEQTKLANGQYSELLRQHEALVTSLGHEKRTIQAMTDKYEHQIKELHGTIDLVRKQLQDAQQTHQEQGEALHQQIAALTLDYQQVQQDYNTLNAKYNSAKEECETLRTRLHAAQKMRQDDLLIVKQKTAKFREHYEQHHEEEMNKLKAKITGLEQKNAELAHQAGELRVSIRQLHYENHRLRAIATSTHPHNPAQSLPPLGAITSGVSALAQHPPATSPHLG